MYIMMKSMARFLGVLSDRGIDRLADAMAYLSFDLLRLRRSLVLQNLETALGDVYEPHERLRIGRESYKNFILTAFEFLRSRSHDIAANVDTIGGDHLSAALAKGQGVYILCFHLGNWEAMCPQLTRNFCPSFVVVKKVGSGGLNRFVEENRQRNGFFWVKRRKKGDGLKGIVEILDRGEIVGFVIDQARPGEPRLPFFGTPAKTNTSLAAIWKRRPAPIVPAYMHRKSVGHHVLEILPELSLKDSGDESQDIIDNSLMFNKEVEKAVRKYPEHYFWLHNRWKS